MALAPFFERAALAASQVIAGYDPVSFERAISSQPVGLSIDSRSCSRREGRALSDLAVRLLARLYPAIWLDVAEPVVRAELADIALAINPMLDLASHAEIGIAVGRDAHRFGTTVFAGSDGWTARVGATRPFGVADSENPFGPGVAACLAAANLFRLVLVPDSEANRDRHISFSAYHGDVSRPSEQAPRLQALDLGSGTALIGLGAIGHGVAWALARAPVQGEIDLVDPETIDLGNLQRYVLAALSDVDQPKTLVLGRALSPRLGTSMHAVPFDEFVHAKRYLIDTAVVGLDSARDRRAVQASLPRVVLNAWTQPGDLGVSIHAPFGGTGACLECLYVIDRPRPNDDEIVAAALGVSDQVRAVRELLHSGGPVPSDLLRMVASRLSIDESLAGAFAGRPIRALYVEGLCGGGLIPLGQAGTPRADVHVPLAHQSALAGLLLAAALVRMKLSGQEPVTQVIRVDLSKALGSYLRQAVAPRTAGCVCRDRDYTVRYATKWTPGS